jgi:16S rRNA A1518/A1519 N6-dimethyltransferase RsmA/KsgA/DIM1 with predicted DNA glycosylase/AP lyase activity
MLKNNLSGIDFDQIGLNPKIRAENLSIADWIKIYETI